MQRKTTVLSSAWTLLVVVMSLIAPVAGRATAATGREPVIIIPGIAGSELTAANTFSLNVDNGHGGTFSRTYSAGEKVWVNTTQAALPGTDDYFDALKLKADTTTPVAPQLAVSGLYSSAYSDLIDYLKRQGYVEGVDLWVFPYDWRMDIRSTVNLLDERVTRALIGANGGRTDPATWTIKRADIVAHSMGGLVARAYIADPTRAARIDQLLTLGAPQLGATKFLKTLLYGETFGPYFLGIGLNPDEVKDLVQNMAGAWQLMPSRDYFTYYDGSDASRLRPYIEDRDMDGNGTAGGALSYDGVTALLRNLGKNQMAQSKTDAFHSALDRQRNGGVNGVRWAALVGYGQGTPGQIREYTGSCWSWFRYVACPKRDETPTDGDGTVPTFSAAMGDPWRDTMIDSGAQRSYIQRSHGALVQRDYTLGVATGDGPALIWIGDMLSGRAPMDATLGSNAATSAVQTAPQSRVSGAWVSAQGPVALQLATPDGRTEGRARSMQAASNEIAGAQYDRLPSAEFGFIQKNTASAANFAAESDGSVEVKVRLLNDGRVVQTIAYPLVRMAAGGTARLTTLPNNASQPAPALEVDADGDGVYEAALQPAAILDERASADITYPSIAVAQPAVVNNEATIRWSASDDLSGLQIEQATLDPDSAAPLLVANGAMVALAPGMHTLEVLAQDRAGNTTVKTTSFVVGGSRVYLPLQQR